LCFLQQTTAPLAKVACSCPCSQSF
jgi:hypothetical protein